MKIKWMLNFLLIALAFNAVSPLLAIEGQNTQTLSIDEDMTGLLNLNLNPIPAIKNCAFGIKDSISGTFSSIGNTLPKSYVLAMLGRAAKEVGSGLYWLGKGAFSVASKIPSLYFEKPETLEGFNKGRVLFTAAVGISTYFIAKQYRALYDIERKLGKAEVNTPNNEDFLFGSWNYESYKTAHDISQNSNRVLQELQLLDSKKYGSISIREALERERKKLYNWLYVISSLTDAPYKILELVKAKQIDVAPAYVWYQETAFNAICLDHLCGLDAYELENFGDSLTEKKSGELYKSVLFIPPGWWDSLWLPSWRVTIWYKKATKLYWEVYKRYLRTWKLLDLVNDNIIPTSHQSVFQPLLNQVNDMIRNQDNAYNDESTKLNQYGRLIKAQKILTDIMNYNSHSNVLITINGKLNSINSFLQTNSKKPKNDTALGDLIDIKGTLEQIIKKKILI